MKRVSKLILLLIPLLVGCSTIKNHVEIKSYEPYDARKPYKYETKYDSTKVKKAMDEFYKNVKEKTNYSKQNSK